MPVTADPTTAMVRWATARTLVFAPVAALAGALWHGVSGAWAAALGALVVTCFFAVGARALNLLVTAVPAFSMVLALVVYATQLMLLLLVYVVFREYVDTDRPAFAFGAAGGTMVWQVTHTLAFRRWRTPLYTIDAPKEEQ